MSNMWSLWEDYEKRYNTWLKNSAVPAATSWYQQSGIDERLKSWQTGLLGQEERKMHPSEGVISTFKGGGALDKAGGVVQDYFTRPTVRTKHPTEGVIEGQKLMSPADRDVSAVGEKTIDVLADIVHWGVKKTDQAFNAMFPHLASQNLSTDAKKKIIQENQKTDPFGQDKRGKQTAITEQDGFSLAKWAGVNMDDVKKNWKDKGGFEGLMSNPAFTLGLALMQSSAQGKTIGEDLMNNFIKGAKLSEHYKDRMDARTEVIGPPTDEDRGMVERFLKDRKFGGPSNWQKVKGWFTGEDAEGDYRRALDAISVEMKDYIAKKYKGKKHRVTEDDFQAAVDRLVASGDIEKTPGLPGFLSNFRQWQGKIIKKKKNLAEGGPAKAGESYVVGEQGPEVFTPNVTGTVTANDDSQIMSMLLASNPQLQNVSKTRAESILRSRFPDYFA